MWIRRVPLSPLPSYVAEGFPASHIRCASSVGTDQPSFRKQRTKRISGRLLNFKRGVTTRGQETLDSLGFRDTCGRVGVLRDP